MITMISPVFHVTDKERTASVRYEDPAYGERVYSVIRMPFASTLMWASGAVEKTAIDIPQDAVPLMVRQALLNEINRRA